jgi:hypothetical protein
MKMASKSWLPKQAGPPAAEMLATHPARRNVLFAIEINAVDNCSTNRVSAPAVALPISTIRQGARVAMHRTRRFTVLGDIPIIGLMVVPWLWPLHMVIVASTAGHIRQTRDASLSYYDGSTPVRHRPSFVVAVLAFAVWLTVLAGTVLAFDAAGDRSGATVIMLVALLPALVELLALLEFAVVNPEWVTIKREQARRSDGRTTYVLTSLVSRKDGHDFAAKLMAVMYPQWQAADAVVIGYPASRALVSYYVRMGARRGGPSGPSEKPARRRVTFDCRRPLRAR